MLTKSNPTAALFIDDLGFWLADQRLAGRLRRRCKRILLKPSPLFGPGRRGLTASLGPAWTRRDELADLLVAADGLGARVTRLDIALDFLGTNAKKARWRFLPSLDDPHADVDGDAIQLDVRSSRIPHGRTKGSWFVHEDGGACYTHPRRAQRNLVAYSDRPSKLAPEGPAVLHAEARLKPPHVPGDPTAIIPLLEDQELVGLFAQHVELLHPVRLLLPRPAARVYIRARAREVVTPHTHR